MDVGIAVWVEKRESHKINAVGLYVMETEEPPKLFD
jgi:hypothetical protein